MEKALVKIEELGLVSYQEAWDFQTEQLDIIRSIKLANRHRDDNETCIHKLIFCEHKPVYTLGKSGSEEHLLLNKKQLEKQGFEYYKINRGGDITYHGPGQLVVYPIFDLDYFYHDVHRYVRALENIVITVLNDYGIKAGQVKDFTGVWIDAPIKRKICAIGVHMSRWVTMHGFALNVQPDLSHFKNIIPCGIDDQDKTVTSISQEIGRKLDFNEVKSKIKEQFQKEFDFKYVS